MRKKQLLTLNIAELGNLKPHIEAIYTVPINASAPMNYKQMVFKIHLPITLQDIKYLFSQ